MTTEFLENTEAIPPTETNVLSSGVSTGFVGSNSMAQTTSVEGMEGVAMTVGGGVHDNAVDVTYSTKPDNPTMVGQGALETTTTASAEYNLGSGAEFNMTTGETLDLGATVGNTINLDAGASGMEFGATTETTGMEFGAGAGEVTTGMEFGATTEATGMELGAATTEATGMEFGAATTEATGMEFGAGAGEVTTGYDLGSAGYAGATTTTTTSTTTTEFGMGAGVGAGAGEGSVMGVGGGIHDEAVDVTYSTKPNQVTNLGTIDLGTVDLGTTYVEKRKSITIPGGIASLAKTTTTTVGVDINTLNIYNRTTLLKDQVQHIIKREIQPIVKTIIKPIIQ